MTTYPNEFSHNCTRFYFFAQLELGISKINLFVWEQNWSIAIFSILQTSKLFNCKAGTVCYYRVAPPIIGQQHWTGVLMHGIFYLGEIKIMMTIEIIIVMMVWLLFLSQLQISSFYFICMIERFILSIIWSNSSYPGLKSSHLFLKIVTCLSARSFWPKVEGHVVSLICWER